MDNIIQKVTWLLKNRVTTKFHNKITNILKTFSMYKKNLISDKNWFFGNQAKVNNFFFVLNYDNNFLLLVIYTFSFHKK